MPAQSIFGGYLIIQTNGFYCNEILKNHYDGQRAEA